MLGNVDGDVESQAGLTRRRDAVPSDFDSLMVRIERPPRHFGGSLNPGEAPVQVDRHDPRHPWLSMETTAYVFDTELLTHTCICPLAQNHPRALKRGRRHEDVDVAVNPLFVGSVQKPRNRRPLQEKRADPGIVEGCHESGGGGVEVAANINALYAGCEFSQQPARSSRLVIRLS
jgi:hypothetical protein